MRTQLRHRRATAAILLVAASLVVAGAMPAAATAQDLPDAVEDPVAAIDPATPAPPPEPSPDPAPDDAPAADDAVAAVAGIADATVQDAPRPTGTAGVAAAPASTPAPVGSLPFTGPDRGRIVLAILVGLLLVTSGVVARSYGSAVADRP